jgi:hypothetical protein
VLAKQTTNQFPVTEGRRDDVPPEIWSVLERAVHAEVEARYPSAAEFLQALNRAAGAGHRQAGDLARVAARWLRI